MSNQLIRTSFYCFWAVSLVLQAIYTGLMADEAYYWMYSHQLDWGYFDHPPIVALVISATSLILDTELGGQTRDDYPTLTHDYFNRILG